MKVKIHKLFSYLLETTQAEPEAVLGFSLSSSPTLQSFLTELSPDISLDWSNESFQGMPSLREKILQTSGLSGICRPEDVLVTAGAAEANYLAIMQRLEPNDEIIIEQPGWPQAQVLAKAIGATVKVLQRREKDAWKFDFAQLEQLISSKTRMIFITNPNNPTGQQLSANELETLAAQADRVGAYLLVDEVYAGLEWQAARAPSIAGLYQRGITTNSVSKALGLQGLRTGWLICQDRELLRDAMILRENSSEIMNVMGEKIADIALQEERYKLAMATAREEGLANLKRLNDYIDHRPELSWQSPKAGLIGLCRLHLEINAEDFAKRLLAPPYRTFVIPGQAYQQPQHIRLGVGGGEEARLGLGLKRLAQCLDDMV